jgi:hypothetical protein
MTEPTRETTMGKQQRKCVSSYGRVKCRKVPHLQPEEILNAWYLPEDFVAAREYERLLRSYISQDRELHLKNEENMCALGLRTENEKRTELRAIKASIQAVLTEQHSQQEQFLDATQNDDDAIFCLNDPKMSSIYSLSALESSRQALSRGLRHARNVKDIASAPASPSPAISARSTKTNPASSLQESTSASCTSAVIFHNFFSTSEASRNDSNIPISNIMTEPTRETTMDKQQRKHISSYGSAKYRKVPYLQPEEILNAWYLPEDFVAAREYEGLLRSYISQDRQLHLKCEKNMCSLGLRTESEKRTKFRAIRASIRAVLTEQHNQQEQFLDATQNDDDAIFCLNDQNISSIYSLSAVESSRQALSRGLRHTRHVKDMTSLQTTTRILDTSFRDPLPISYYNTMQEYKPRNDMNSPLHLFMSDIFREKTAYCEGESLRIRIVFDDAPGSDGYKS